MKYFFLSFFFSVFFFGFINNAFALDPTTNINFGGTYHPSGSSCAASNNVFTGAQSCPTGYTDYNTNIACGVSGTVLLHFCYATSTQYNIAQASSTIWEIDSPAINVGMGFMMFITAMSFIIWLHKKK
jgi:hypothetical protein